MIIASTDQQGNLTDNDLAALSAASNAYGIFRGVTNLASGNVVSAGLNFSVGIQASGYNNKAAFYAASSNQIGAFAVEVGGGKFFFQ